MEIENETRDGLVRRFALDRDFVDYALSALGAGENGQWGTWLVSGTHAKKLYWILRREQQRLTTVDDRESP